MSRWRSAEFSTDATGVVIALGLLPPPSISSLLQKTSERISVHARAFLRPFDVFFYFFFLPRSLREHVHGTVSSVGSSPEECVVRARLPFVLFYFRLLLVRLQAARGMSACHDASRFGARGVLPPDKGFEKLATVGSDQRPTANLFALIYGLVSAGGGTVRLKVVRTQFVTSFPSVEI